VPGESGTLKLDGWFDELSNFGDDLLQ